ncbi:hypothetical protein PVAND_017227 [Polypedilum vanderplanki]|uniref:Glucose dehydrogenase n=1 Tax=Polypedilum vanderplanki TaxID=319348 RepID=A0A9J6BIG5_POLVA|nr:hypothetical protein PVAND_017227 [Polypedilum vanderplanki]
MFNYFLYFILITIFKIFSEFLFFTENSFDSSLPVEDNYDFIVVGSGSSGGLIATNLKGKVLLIEAGAYGSGVFFNIPIIQPLLLRSKYDWKHETISQENSCKAMNGNKCFWPAGKILSGSHRLNNMIYHRGFKEDYENYVNGNLAEKLFEEVEKNIPVSETNFKSKAGEAFIYGMKEIGFEVLDFNFTNLTQFYGKRYTQFYNWHRKTSAPETILNAQVTKIIFKNKNAIGIEFIKNDKIHKIFGKKIILSAGTIGSAKILLHSGVGPKKHLEEMGIEIIENLPVGENLQDHVTTNIDLMVAQKSENSILDVCNPWKIIKYFWNGSGPMSLGGSDAMGFLKLQNSSITPDLSFIFLPVGIADDFGIHLRKVLNFKDDLWEKFYKPLTGQSFATILPIILHPKSRGNLRLSSKNFNDPILIDPKYYEAKNDIKIMIKAIRIIQKLIETSIMKEIGAELIPKSLPGCENFKFNSDDYWECYVRHLTLTMYHPVGTCKMGNYDENSTVVLKNFQVKNLENLFVVDGSVLSNSPSANPHALISMLAMKFTNEMNKEH